MCVQGNFFHFRFYYDTPGNWIMEADDRENNVQRNNVHRGLVVQLYQALPLALSRPRTHVINLYAHCFLCTQGFEKVRPCSAHPKKSGPKEDQRGVYKVKRPALLYQRVCMP